MPKVPYSDNVVPMRAAPQPPDQQSLMLAAGMMYQEGKLFDRGVDKLKGMDKIQSAPFAAQPGYLTRDQQKQMRDIQDAVKGKED